MLGEAVDRAVHHPLSPRTHCQYSGDEVGTVDGHQACGDEEAKRCHHRAYGYQVRQSLRTTPRTGRAVSHGAITPAESAGVVHYALPADICFAVLLTEAERLWTTRAEHPLVTFAPGHRIVLFNGGSDRSLHSGLDIDVCPYSRPLRYGFLPRFHSEVMRWLVEDDRRCDMLINVETDMALIKPDIEGFLDRTMTDSGYMGAHFEIVPDPPNAPWCQPIVDQWPTWQSWFQTGRPYTAFNPGQAFRWEYIERFVRTRASSTSSRRWRAPASLRGRRRCMHRWPSASSLVQSGILAVMPCGRGDAQLTSGGVTPQTLMSSWSTRWQQTRGRRTVGSYERSSSNENRTSTACRRSTDRRCRYGRRARSGSPSPTAPQNGSTGCAAACVSEPPRYGRGPSESGVGPVCVVVGVAVAGVGDGEGELVLAGDVDGDGHDR